VLHPILATPALGVLVDSDGDGRCVLVSIGGHGRGAEWDGEGEKRDDEGCVAHEGNVVCGVQFGTAKMTEFRIQISEYRGTRCILKSVF
jgi:hypothetical protein